jgi:hypothetical protein
MAADPGLESTRRYSIVEVKRILGIADPTIDRLFARARAVLGQERATECLELARLAPLTRRHVPASAIASLVAGSVVLGTDWWLAPHEELDASREWVSRGVPDRVLAAGHDDPETEDGGSCLATLAAWIADDAATKQWGKPIDRFDGPYPPKDSAAVLPHDARAGDRLTVAVGPGCRVMVDVFAKEGQVSHGMSRLDSTFGERVVHDVALIRSAWTMATSGAPVRLPGEMAGRHGDPFSSKLEASDSRCLFEWAVANGANGRDLAGPWRTKDALWSARLRLGLPFSRPGAWLTFDEAVVALVDDDERALSAALADLGC